MPSSLSAHVGTHCRAASDARKKGRTLILGADQTHRGIDGLFAVIDGASQQVDEACEYLQLALGPAPTDLTAEGNTICLQLRDILACVKDKRVSVAMAVWSGSTVEVASVGDGKAYFFGAERGDAIVASHSDPIPHLQSFEVSPGDVVILIDSGVASCVLDREVRQEATVGFSGDFTESHAAAWLGTLALRSSQTAAVVITRFKGRPSRGAEAVKTSRVSFPSKPTLRIGMPRRSIGPLRLSGHVKLVLVSALGCAFVFGGTAAVLKLGTNLTVASPPGNAKVAGIQSSVRSTFSSVPARAVPTVMVVKTSAQPIKTWRFPPLGHAPGGNGVLTLYNPTKNALGSDVRILTTKGLETRHEHFPPAQSVALALPSADVRDASGRAIAMYVQTTGPIVPLGLMIRP